MTKGKFKLATAALALAGIAFASSVQAQGNGRVEVGVLNCIVDGGTGFIFGSSKALSCELKRPGRNEGYDGRINKFGVDIGFTTKSYISWAVFAPTSDIAPGALDGEYGGVSAEATAALGVGANALIGGSNRSIVLQPLSVQAQKGLNVALGVASLRLRYAR